MAYNKSKIEKEVIKHVRNGLDKSSVFYAIIKSEEFRSLDAADKNSIQSDVDYFISRIPAYPDIQNFMNSIVLQLSNEGNKLVIYNPVTHTVKNDTYEGVCRIINKAVVNSKLSSAIAEYNPRSPKKVFRNAEGDQIYNTYNPPAWLKDHFYNGCPVEPAPMPELYEKFFRHVVDNDEESYNYLLNWVAYSLKGRNLTTLAAVGTQGVGKGILGKIIAKLHGMKEKNGAPSIHGTKFDSNFNEILEGKTFIEFSEFALLNAKEVNNFKQLANADLDMEGKGKKRQLVKNYVNIFATANNMTNIKVAADDRRFSFLNLTTEKLVSKVAEFGFESIEALADALEDDNAINQLAAYLWNFKPNRALLAEPFKSKTLEKIRKANLTDWQKEFLASYCRQHEGKTRKLVDVTSDLDIMLNKKLKLSSRSFEVLSNNVKPLLTGKKIFELARERQDDGSYPTVLRIAPLGDQPDESFFNSFDIIEEV